MTKEQVITERFQNWIQLIKTVQIITGGEFTIYCNNGGINDAIALFQMDRLLLSHNDQPKDYCNQPDVDQAFSDLLRKIKDQRITGEVVLKVLSFFGHIYKIKVRVETLYSSKIKG